MTREQALSKLDEMMPDLMEAIRRKYESALRCGALDLEEWQDDFRLPKVILTAVLEDMTTQYQPIGSTLNDRKSWWNVTLRNLRNFV